MMSRQGKTGSAVVLTDHQLKIVFKTILGSGSVHTYRNYLIIILSHLCGLRSKELASLKVSDVMVGGKVVDTLRLIGSYTKGNKHRDIPLNNHKVINAIEVPLMMLPRRNMRKEGKDQDYRKYYSASSRKIIEKKFEEKFNQDIEFKSEIKSPGWIRYQKRIKHK